MFSVGCMLSIRRHALYKLTGPTPCKPFRASSTNLRLFDMQDALRLLPTSACLQGNIYPWPLLKVTFRTWTRSTKQGSSRSWAQITSWTFWTICTKTTTRRSRLLGNRPLSRVPDIPPASADGHRRVSAIDTRWALWACALYSFALIGKRYWMPLLASTISLWSKFSWLKRFPSCLDS